MEATAEVARTMPPLLYKITHEVGEDDIDALGHASNIAYVRWIQDVAIAHSSSVGFDLDAYAKLGAIFVIRRHEVDYLRPVLRGDRLEVRTWIDRAFAAKCHLATEIAKLTDGVELIVARAMTTWGFVEITGGRPTRIPLELRRAFLPDA